MSKDGEETDNNTFLVQTRFLRLRCHFCSSNLRASGVYIPIRPLPFFPLSPTPKSSTSFRVGDLLLLIDEDLGLGRPLPLLPVLPIPVHADKLSKRTAASEAVAESQW